MTNTRASELRTQRYENRTLLKAIKSRFRYIFCFRKSYGEQRQDPGRECRNF